MSQKIQMRFSLQTPAAGPSAPEAPSSCEQQCWALVLWTGHRGRPWPGVKRSARPLWWLARLGGTHKMKELKKLLCKQVFMRNITFNTYQMYLLHPNPQTVAIRRKKGTGLYADQRITALWLITSSFFWLICPLLSRTNQNPVLHGILISKLKSKVWKKSVLPSLDVEFMVSIGSSSLPHVISSSSGCSALICR